MTRRDFEHIAATVAAVESAADRARMAREWADRLAPTNPRFDRARFLRACGAVS